MQTETQVQQKKPKVIPSMKKFMKKAQEKMPHLSLTTNEQGQFADPLTAQMFEAYLLGRASTAGQNHKHYFLATVDSTGVTLSDTPKFFEDGTEVQCARGQMMKRYKKDLIIIGMNDIAYSIMTQITGTENPKFHVKPNSAQKSKKHSAKEK